MKKLLGAVLLSAYAILPGIAQEKQDLLKLSLGARVDWQLDRTEDHTNDDETGFKGKYLMFRADGRIIDGLTYSWRQRFNKNIVNGNFFDATDWLYLQYKPGRWGVSAGKEIVAIGGYEYDAYPVDIFVPSVYWWNTPCYAFGVTGIADVSAHDTLKAQITQSMFHNYPGNKNNTYGYSLYWAAHHGFWKPLWSINLFEYNPGRYINYIVLGNEFEYGPLSLRADFFNRAASGQTFLFRDVTVIGELGWNINEHWQTHLKYTYDVNKSGTDKDCLVLNGTEMNSISAGAEYYPLKKDRWSLRLHANIGYYWGTNTNPDDFMQRNTLFANVGLTFHINLLNLKK